MNRQRAAALFDQAIEVSEEERAAWLEAQCGDDADLRRELERLLRADAQAQDFLETPPAWIADALAASELSTETTAPTDFGPWRVVRSIGVGGMGEVWLAERSDGDFEQRVAIKQLAYPTPGLLARFRQERQILARLEHPNIARLIDGGVDAHGAPYLAMEYVEGVPIIAWAQQHALDARACLQLFLRVCAAVQYAHQNLVVHRDLKPSNIFVTAEGEPKLLDFGIAKVLATTDEAAPTQTVARMLTPGYAAPEQFHGGPITTATDVYALGVVLYELLADTRPPRPERSGTTPDAAIDTSGPLPPSAVLDRTRADTRARRRLLRGDLDRIVLTALATDPARRYPSAAALATDIRNWLAGRPIAARGDNAAYRLHKFVRRNRYALGAAAFVLVVSLAAAAISLQQAHQARLQADAALKHAARADAVRQFLTGIFEQANPDENQGKSFTAHELLERGERQVADMDGHTTSKIEVTSLLATLYWNIGDFERARALFDGAMADLSNPAIANEIKARLLADRSAMETDQHDFERALEHGHQALAFARMAGENGARAASAARHSINYALVRKRDSAGAEAQLRATLAEDRATFGESDDAVADSWSNLGEVLDDFGRYEEATKAYENALRIRRQLHGDRHSSVLETLNGYGLMLLHKGDLAAAETALRECAESGVRLYGEDNTNAISAQSNLLRVLEMRGRFAEVLPQRLRILDAERARPAGSRPHKMALAHNFIGVDQRELGQFEDAERSFRQSLALWLQIHGDSDNADSAAPLSNLGLTLELQGRYAEAETAFRKAWQLERDAASESAQWTNIPRAYLGNLLRRRHRNDEALRELSAANTALRNIGAGASSWQALAQAKLSEAELDDNRAAATEVSAREALATARSSLPEGNLRLGVPLYALARADLALERPSDAEPLLREALAVRGAVHPPHDPRVLEVKVALTQALRTLGRPDEAAALTAEIEPLLQGSSSPYLADLRGRLFAR